MVVPINPIFTGRGKTPLEPQFFYTPVQTVLYGQPFAQYNWPLPAGHQAQLAAQASPDYTWISNWTPRYQFPPPDTTKLFRGHLRSLPPQPYPPNFFQSWTQSFFLPDLPLPPGEQVTDLAPAQRPPEQVQLHSWTASYNLNLIGKDQLPSGKDISDLAPGQRPPEQIQLHVWTWNYNLNLIGQDRMTVGKQVYDLTVSQRLPELPRSWTLDLSTTTLFPVAVTKPFNQYDWQLPQGHQAQQQRDFTFVSDWTPRFAFPPPDNTKIFRPHYRSLPDQPAPPLLQQSVFQAYPALYTVAVAQLPFNQYDWPTPRAPQQPAQSYTASYNLSLIGQDKLPNGEQVSDLPPRDFARLFQTWIQTVSLGFRVPPPIRQPDWPLPRGYEPDWRRDWEWWYNLNLIGQDRLPAGKQVFDLPPRDFQRLFQTWTWSYDLNLIGQDLRPFNQFDWPVPKAPQQPAQSFTASYNLNLIGQDQLPTGARSFDLTPADYQRILQTWITNVSLALTTAPVQGPLGVVANQYDWPVPRTPAQPERSITASNPNLYPPGPPTTQLHQNPFFITMGRLSQLGNLPS